MEKDIEYYMKLPYRRELLPEAEGGWFIRIVELPGCMSQGETVEEANAMIEDAMRGWIEAELASGSAIPEPRQEEEFSGKFVVRVAKSLHRKIDEVAEREGVSLNQWIGTVLSEAIGKAFAHIPEEASRPQTSSDMELFSSIGSILQDVGFSRENISADEVLFGNWFEQNLLEIQQDCKDAHFEASLTKIRDLSYVIEKHAKRSPVMRSIQTSLSSQIVILEETCNLKRKVDEADQMRSQIGSIIGVVNTSRQQNVQSEVDDLTLYKNTTDELLENARAK